MAVPRMTEAEWLASDDPHKMLAHVRAGLADPRVFRLTAASFRRHWDRLPEAGRAFTRLAEAAAGGEATRQDLDDAFDGLEEALNDAGLPGEFAALLDLAYGMWQSSWWELDGDEAWRAERRAQADLVRSVFENPFRSPRGAGSDSEPGAAADCGV